MILAEPLVFACMLQPLLLTHPKAAREQTAYPAHALLSVRQQNLHPLQ
jgi:hypothetical protein